MIEMHQVGPVTMTGTATHTVKSATLEHNLRIDVSMPMEYEGSTRSYPVVYLIDGNWYFPIVSYAVRPLELAGELPPLVAVGIGYEPKGLPRAKEEERVMALRTRYLTPTLDASDWWRETPALGPIAEGIENGHAEDLIHVIEHEVKPLVRRHYRADGNDETLAGVSLGGLFALHVLFQHTDAFDRYVAGSPSLWWDGGVMFDFEREYADRNQDLSKALFLSIGELEQSDAQAWAQMVSNWKLLTERLAARRYPSMRWESLMLGNETHATGIASTFIKGMLSVFRS